VERHGDHEQFVNFLKGCYSEPERSEGEESRVVPAAARFFVAEFILNEVEGLLRMTSSKTMWTDY
jgi:hypothetical protein